LNYKRGCLVGWIMVEKHFCCCTRRLREKRVSLDVRLRNFGNFKKIFNFSSCIKKIILWIFFIFKKTC
jgi:hypothetical protein